MAAITLNNFKPRWQGAYNSGTTYSLNMIVSYAGSSWIYKSTTAGSGNAPPSSGDSNTQWARLNKGSDIGSLTLSAGDVLKYDGSNFTPVNIGAAGQIIKVNSGGTDLEFGVGGKDLKYYHHRDATRTTGSGENVTWMSNRTVYTKTSSTSNLFIIGEFKGKNNQGNDCAVPQITITDSSSNQWRTTANYVGNGGHTASQTNYRFFAHIGSLDTFYRISGSATYAAAGTITMSYYHTSASGVSNDSWRSFNSDNNDDGRMYPHSDSRSHASPFTFFEVEP